MNAKQRVALVTGAARGLGRGIAVDLAAHGYRVAFTFRPAGTPPDETARRIQAYTGDAPFAIPADHERDGQTRIAIEQALAAFGQLDVLIHAVGPLLTHAFRRASLAEYRTLFDGNVTSAVEAAFAVLPAMRERHFGRLVFFGMKGSHATAPARNMSLYAAAKAAVVCFARTLAVEEARHGITVNVIEPGDIREKDVDRSAARALVGDNPTGHAGSWEDVASAVRFLIDDDADFLNGITLPVDGGLTKP